MVIWVLIGVVALQWVRSKITRLAVRKKEDILVISYGSNFIKYPSIV
jgi:hypothetical protein